MINPPFFILPILYLVFRTSYFVPRILYLVFRTSYFTKPFYFLADLTIDLPDSSR